MQISLTEQQARVVAAAARLGLRVHRETGITIEGVESVSDEGSAYAALEVLDDAWKEAVGR